MEAFKNSHKPIVTNSTFTHIEHRGPSAIAQLHATIADGAMHNSGKRFDPPKCYPGTREVILQQLLDWIIEHDHEAFMRWLFGPAGAGKSAILQEIAEKCAKKKLLLASFFFSRTASFQDDEKRLITTIAYQLALSIPQTRPYIEQVIEHDPAIFSKSLESQLLSFVVEPLNQAFSAVGEESTPWPYLILIDGLDECGTPAVQQHILTILLTSAANCKFPIMFLISSRPETHLVMTLTQDIFKPVVRTALGDDYRPEEDIRLFLEGTFRDIKERHPLRCYLSGDWPSRDVMNTLVRKSSGQFIYAATVARYISPEGSHPAECLEIVLGISNATVRESPFAQLDALYTHILSSLPNEPASLRVLALLVFPGLKSTWTPRKLDEFLGLRAGFAEWAVNKLASLIKLDSESGIQVLHASLADFLFDEHRSGAFHIKVLNEGAHFARLCLKYFVSGTDEAVYEDAIRNILSYCRNAAPVKELVSDLANLDLRAVAQSTLRRAVAQRVTVTKSLFTPEQGLRRDPLLKIIPEYLQCSKVIKANSNGGNTFVSECQQTVQQFIKSQVALYRSISPMLLHLLVVYLSHPDNFCRFDLPDQDLSESPYNWVDFPLASSHHPEFKSSVLTDDSSLRIRYLPSEKITTLEDFMCRVPATSKVYIPFLTELLKAEDFSKAAGCMSSYIVSSQASWSSITAEDRQRASVVLGKNIEVASDLTPIQELDKAILEMKHKAYKIALEYLGSLLPRASIDAELSNLLRSATVGWDDATAPINAIQVDNRRASNRHSGRLKDDAKEAIACYLERCDSMPRLCLEGDEQTVPILVEKMDEELDPITSLDTKDDVPFQSITIESEEGSCGEQTSITGDKHESDQPKDISRIVREEAHNDESTQVDTDSVDTGLVRLDEGGVPPESQSQLPSSDSWRRGLWKVVVILVLYLLGTHTIVICLAMCILGYLS